MALLPYLDKDTLPPRLRESAERFQKLHGRPGWLRLLAAHYEPLADALDGMYPRFIDEGQLDRQTKELIFVAGADVRNCLWCAGGHSRLLVREYGLTREQVLAARRGGDVEGLTEQQRVLIRFARRLAEDPKQIGPDDIEELRSVGLDNSGIIEAVAVCCMSAFTNTFTDGLKLADDLEQMGLAGEYF